MMRKMLAALLFVVVWPASAAAFTYQWAPIKGAVSFDIEQATLTLQPDGHYLLSPWTLASAGVLISTCTKTTCSITIPPPGPLVLYRITTYFATGVKSTRTYAGAWYHEGWLIPGTAGSAEIK